MTPAQLRELRSGLPVFPGRDAPDDLQREFCHFYGIDFQDRLPGIRYSFGGVRSGVYTLAAHCWLQAGARSNLLLVHGYYDHSGLYGKLIEYGLLQNCNVLIFDLPGHGLSSGEPAAIDDFIDYGHAIAAVLAAARLPAIPTWVMAQSTGGAALIEYARQYPWPFAATVLLAPLVRPAGWKLGRLTHSLLRSFTHSIERKFAANTADTDFLEFQQRDPLQSRRLPVSWVSALRRWLDSLPVEDLGAGPVLFVQGDADQTVDWRYNIGAYKSLFPGSQVRILPGAQHQLANESPELRHTYLEWVGAWLAESGVPLARYGVSI